MNKSIIFIIILVLLFSSCSTIPKSVSLGMITGGVTGGLIAPGLVNKEKKNALVIGALIGIALGGIGGYFTHKKLEERDEQVRKDMMFNLETNAINTQSTVGKDSIPDVLKPKVEKIWVEPKIEGGKYIQGHFIWQIIDEARWNEDSNKKNDSNDQRNKEIKSEKSTEEK
ncbi:MAG: hypothetical protein HQK49_21795 [Oligoflexia bacterium]|nr:hypothetical protein [Oligoflexia bacterium]